MAFGSLFPPKVLIGGGALKMAAPLWQQMGHKALIVTDPMMVRLGNIAKLEEVLKTAKLSYHIYQDITGEPAALSGAAL